MFAASRVFLAQDIGEIGVVTYTTPLTMTKVAEITTRARNIGQCVSMRKNEWKNRFDICLI